MPTMPTLPSRKLNRLWSSSATKASASTSPETGATPTDEEKDISEDRSTRESSQQAQQRLRQLFQEKEKDGLAADISIRRKTNERLYLAVEAYWSSLSKVKNLPFEMSAASALEVAMTLDEAKAACKSTYANSSPLVLQAAEEGSKSVTSTKEKMLPVEALGLAMASCANTYLRSQKEDPEDKMKLKKNEVYASHLSHLSAVHLALAQLQLDYTSSLSSTLLSRLARSQAAIEALRTTEKQTEATREKMEIAEKKRDRAKEKGEKNRRDVEEEARMARATYEEAVADLETRTEILRESEQRGPGSGVAILKEYMDIHLAWIEAQHEVMSKARAALDQYPNQATNLQTSSNTTINASAPIRSRVAPPPPPVSSQAATRRIVEPPPHSIREEQRKRSVSSSNVTHKPKLSSRGSLQDVLIRHSATAKEEETVPRPASRESSSFTDSTPSRSVKSRIPFVRSESYSNVNTSNEASGSENAGKSEMKKGRMSAIGASLGRSSSSLGLTNSDTAKTTPTTTGGTGTSLDPSGSEKGSSWASSLLSRKSNNAKKDGNYQVMTGNEPDVRDHIHRSLSHVQEGSTESKPITDDFLGLQPQKPTIVYKSDSDHDDVLIATNRRDVYDAQTPSPLKAWEKFGDRRDSLLGISSHHTGNSISSEGSNPFGPEGSELSPVGTGNGFFAQQQFAKDTWGRNAEDDDDPADGLLSVKGEGTIRRPARK